MVMIVFLFSLLQGGEGDASPKKTPKVNKVKAEKGSSAKKSTPKIHREKADKNSSVKKVEYSKLLALGKA